MSQFHSEPPPSHEPMPATPASVPAGRSASSHSPQTQTQTLDPNRVAFLLEQMRTEQNLLLATLAGTAGALLGASAWAVVTYLTNYQIGWMAVGIGFLVGFMVRAAGKGIDPVYGAVGAALSVLGCVAGNLLTICIAISQQQQMPLLEVITRLNPAAIPQLMVATFHPMDLLFYGIAVYYGYKLSFRQVTQEELAARPT